MRWVAVPALALLLSACASSDSETQQDQRMAEEHRHETPAPSPAALQDPARPVESRNVQYAIVDRKPITGYLAWPGGSAQEGPALIVIHEWWGLNDNVRAMTRRLAGEGYVALAVDLYGGRVAADTDRALELMQESRKPAGAIEDNLRQARDWLAGKRHASKIGAIGWCFGGGWALNTALMMPEGIDAVVLYYGRLETDPERLRVLSMPILGFFGEEDESIPVATVRAFEHALASVGHRAEIHVYPGAGHAFANPTGDHYRAEPAEDAWNRTVAFLAEQLGS